MDDAVFVGIITRAADSKLIPGIYNYCDRRCERCAFTDRCLQFLERRLEQTEAGAGTSVGRVVVQSLERSLDMLQIIGRRLGVDLIQGPDLEPQADWAPEPAGAEPVQQVATPDADPLVVSAREYAITTWPILRALRPILEARGEPSLLEAMDTLEASCTNISAKVFRAVWNSLEAGFNPSDVQNDANGSAKIAKLMIDEARQSWRTLMERGRATSDGVPARLVRLLDDLDAAIRARFPDAMAFVRPGFDTRVLVA